MEINIVKPYAKLLYVDGSPFVGAGHRNAVGIDALRKIEGIGRVSHRSEDAQTEYSYTRFLETVIGLKGDWSIVEHVHASAEILCDRGISHEIVRHRLFSYTQESTRFVNYEKKIGYNFIKPEAIQATETVWKAGIQHSMEHYQMLVNENVTPQIARSTLPNALATKIIMTGNLRSWRWFFLMRTTKEAHPQMREITIPLLAEFKETFPILYDDIEVEARQAHNQRLPK